MGSPSRALLAISVSLVATACAYVADDETIVERYEYRPAEDAPYSLVEGERERQATRGERASVRVRLPEVTADDPAVYVPRSFYLREVWIGERRVYQDGEDAWTVIALPRDHVGQELRVDYLPRASELITSPVRLGSHRALLRRRVLRDVPELAVGAALLILGLFVGAAGLRRRAARGYRPLGFLAVVVGVITIAQTEQLVGVLYPSAAARLYVADAAFFAIPGAIGLFVRALFGDTDRRLLFLTSIASFGVGVVGLAYDLSGLGSWGSFYALEYTCLAAVIALSAKLLWQALRAGDGAAKNVLAGLVAMTLLALPDIGWGLDLVNLGFQTSHWAALALITSLSLALERRFVAQSARLEETTSELEERVESLSERYREIDALNQELRYQISARSRQLSASLSGALSPLPAARAIREGMLFDERYRVGHALGSGGMGTVHAAQRLTDGRVVALKVMTGDVSRQGAARFVREAEIAAKFAHPNLVTVLDVGVDAGGAPFLVMEKINGPSLESERPRFGDVPWALAILRDVARALEELHAHDVVHRDLKPANVLLDIDADERTTAKVSDFGISHLAEAPALDGPDTLPPVGAAPTLPADARSRLTKTGALLGTPAYMAPELALGAHCATTASDVYAFGLMACEMLGHPPSAVPIVFLAWSGQSITTPSAEVLLQTSREIPPQLAELVARAVAIDPKERPSAEELLAALE